MGGLLADWRRFQDPINNVNQPGQMAPQWFQIQKQTGTPLNSDLWHLNPPASSHPACIAQKAAELLSLDFAERYLRRLREAAMLDARDISEQDVLIAIAQETNAACDPENAIDLKDFRSALESQQAQAAFREDLKDVRFMELGRFPTVIFHRPDNRGLALTGYRPYHALREGLARFAPDIATVIHDPNPLGIEELEGYVSRWQRVTFHELQENFALVAEQAREELERRNFTQALSSDLWSPQPDVVD